MNNETLADRLNNYSDGLVAATFVFMTGIGAAVGDTDIRCELAEAAPKMIVFVALAAATVLYSLRWLRQWSARLRANFTISEDVTILQKKLDVVRIVLTCLFFALACVLLLSARTDPSCAAVL